MHDTQSIKRMCWIRTDSMFIPAFYAISSLFLPCDVSCWLRTIFFASKLSLYVSRFENTSKHAKDAYEDKNLSVCWVARTTWKHTCNTSSNQTEVSGGEGYWWWELCCCEAVCWQVSAVIRMHFHTTAHASVILPAYEFLSESLKNCWGYSTLNLCRFAVVFFVWNAADSVSVEPLSLLCIYWMWNDKFSCTIVCVLCSWRLVHVSILNLLWPVLRWWLCASVR